MVRVAVPGDARGGPARAQPGPARAQQGAPHCATHRGPPPRDLCRVGGCGGQPFLEDDVCATSRASAPPGKSAGDLASTEPPAWPRAGRGAPAWQRPLKLTSWRAGRGGLDVIKAVIVSQQRPPPRVALLENRREAWRGVALSSQAEGRGRRYRSRGVLAAVRALGSRMPRTRNGGMGCAAVQSLTDGPGLRTQRQQRTAAPPADEMMADDVTALLRAGPGSPRPWPAGRTDGTACLCLCTRVQGLVMPTRLPKARRLQRQ